jgi:hypothetical protein
VTVYIKVISSIYNSVHSPEAVKSIFHQIDLYFSIFLTVSLYSLNT